MDGGEGTLRKKGVNSSCMPMAASQKTGRCFSVQVVWQQTGIGGLVDRRTAKDTCSHWKTIGFQARSRSEIWRKSEPVHGCRANLSSVASPHRDATATTRPWRTVFERCALPVGGNCKYNIYGKLKCYCFGLLLREAPGRCGDEVTTDGKGQGCTDGRPGCC